MLPLAEGFRSSKTGDSGPAPRRNAVQKPLPLDIQQVLEAHAQGCLDDPLAKYRDLYARGSRHGVVLINLAQLELDAGHPDQAVRHSQSFVARNPGFASAWLILGVAQRRLGQTKPSIQSLRQAVTLDQTNWGLGSAFLCHCMTRAS